MKANIIAGPTHSNQPVFQWSESQPKFPNQKHYGQPDRFDFDWKEVQFPATFDS